MSENDEAYVPPLGDRYSQLYLKRGTTKSDSVKLRRRIGAYVKNHLHTYAHLVGNEIESGIGTDFFFDGYGRSVAEYLTSCSENDFRDAITMIYRAIGTAYKRDRYTSHEISRKNWLAFCQGVFVEENVSFRVDNNCIVRPFVDEEFAASSASLLKGLDDPRLRAVKAEVEAAIDKLGGRAPDTKAAVRSAFEANEIYLKLAITRVDVKRLNRKLVDEHIIPLVKFSAINDPEKSSSTHYLSAFCEWIDACHIYRHGQGTNEPSPPPPDFAIALVASGLAFLRYLLERMPLDGHIKSDLQA